MICGYEIDGNRACGFVVPSGLAPRSKSLFLHSMSLGIGYRFHSLTILSAKTSEITSLFVVIAIL